MIDYKKIIKEARGKAAMKKIGNKFSHGLYMEGWDDACAYMFERIEAEQTKGLDFDDLSKKLDTALENETDESLCDWLNEKWKTQKSLKNLPNKI